MSATGTIFRNRFAVLEFRNREFKGLAELAPFVTLTVLGRASALDAWVAFRDNEIWPGRPIAPEQQAGLTGSSDFLKEFVLYGDKEIDVWALSRRLGPDRIHDHAQYEAMIGITELFEQAS